MPRNKSASLPPATAEVVRRLGELIEAGTVSSADVSDALAQIAKLPPQSIPTADAEIATLADLFRRYERRPSLLHLFTPNRDHLDLLDRQRYLAPFFMFHRDGYVREAALASLSGPLASPFFVAAVAWRLNDWARPVRIAALHCAERTLPLTSGQTVAGAAPFLLDRWRRWGRWDQQNAAIVDRTLQRSDVAPYLAEWFSLTANGPLATLFRYALRGSNLDEYLPGLARQAIQPAVRAVALQTLIKGRASWPEGFGTEWVDKRFGLSRRIPLLAHRPVQSPETVETLIRAGLQDRSASVRRVAADALIERRATFPELGAAIAKLSAEKSASLRERGEFLARKCREEALDLSGAG